MRYLVLASLSLTSVATAQLLTNPVQDYINRTTLLNNILSNARFNAMVQTPQPSSATQEPVPAADPTKFTPSAGFRLPKLLAEKAAAPELKLPLEKALSEFLNLYKATATKDGFPANDLAYAIEYFLVNTYMTAHDLHNVAYEKDPRVRRGKDMFDRITIVSQKKLLTPTVEHERIVYNQLRTFFASNPSVAAMTDVQKQEASELLAIMFGFNFKAYIDAVNNIDDRSAEQARQTARSYLEKLTGTPADRIKIGAAGLQLQ